MRLFATTPVIFGVIFSRTIIFVAASETDRNDRGNIHDPYPSHAQRITTLRGHGRRDSLTPIPNVKESVQARKIRVLEEDMVMMLKKKLSNTMDKNKEGSSSDFSRRLLFEEVARKLESITEEENDQLKSLVNQGIGHIRRALATIKKPAEDNDGPFLHVEDFAKMLSSLLEDLLEEQQSDPIISAFTQILDLAHKAIIMEQGNGNDEMRLNSLVLEIKSTLNKPLSSINEHHRHHPLLDDEMLDTHMALFKDVLMDLSMTLEDNINGLETFLSSQAADVSAAMASYLEQEGSTTSRGDTDVFQGGPSPLSIFLYLLLIIILFPFFIVGLPFYLLIECGVLTKVLPTEGTWTICDIFNKNSAWKNEDGDGALV